MKSVGIVLLKFSILPALTALFFSCTNYYGKIMNMQNNIAQSNFVGAKKDVESNKFLLRKRNQLLYCLEMGKILHLNQEYDSSNYYFNKADLLMEQYNSVLDVMVGNLINPGTMPYRAEDVELVLVHYYKAMNYLMLGKKEDAIVEAKRINLRLSALSDKNNRGKNKYRTDAFSLLLAGLIYESDRDYNNAFISYRNAYEAYSTDSLSIVYGSQMPERLKLDLIKSAYAAGFNADAKNYEKLFNINYKSKEKNAGELILFWENGLSPFKVEENLYFMLSENSGAFYFVNGTNDLSVPFVVPSNVTMDKNTKKKLLGVEMFKMALPKYVMRQSYYSTCTISPDSLHAFNLELAQNVDHIAIKTLNDRMIKETALALERAALKAIEAIAVGVKHEGAGELIQLANMFIERADTRNWQTLPSTINYIRLPLKEGKNCFVIKLHPSNNTPADSMQICVEGKGKMVFKSISTLKTIASP